MFLQGFSRCQKRNTPKEQRISALLICDPWAAEVWGWRSEALLTSRPNSEGVGLFLTQLPALLPASLSGESSSAGSDSAMLLGAASTGAQVHCANWLHTVVSTLQCLMDSAFFRPTSNVQLPMPHCTTTKVFEVICLLIYLHHTLLVSLQYAQVSSPHCIHSANTLHVTGCHCCWHDMWYYGQDSG